MAGRSKPRWVMDKNADIASWEKGREREERVQRKPLGRERQRCGERKRQEYVEFCLLKGQGEITQHARVLPAMCRVDTLPCSQGVGPSVPGG